ncbi:hypothetical protein K9L67_00515 [Candidatus Woesearchaeota archaeon]|nr:hypothetical protein [Candidatus Woesearchaeota archaeon]
MFFIFLFFLFVSVSIFSSVDDFAAKVSASGGDASDAVFVIEESFGDIRIVLPYAFTLIFVPFFALVFIPNVFSNLINKGVFKLLTFRVSRKSIFLALVCSISFLFLFAIIISFLFLFLFLFLFYGVDFHNLFFVWTPLIVSILYSISIVCLFSLTSIFFRSATLSMALSLLFIILFLIISNIGFFQFFSIFYYLPKVTEDAVFKIDWRILGFLGLSFIFVFIGNNIFKRRVL